MSVRALPVVARRLEPGDVILTDADGQVQVDRKQATCQRTLVSVQVKVDDDKQPVRVLLTDVDNEAWSVWPTDVAWLMLPKREEIR